MKVPTILIHGLWLRSPVMWWLGARLRSAGFPVSFFNYSTTRVPFDHTVQRLRELIDTMGPEVNLVGHSLGGLLAVAAASNSASSGKVVALGSPFNGSIAAMWLAKTPAGAAMLGKTRELFGRKFEILLSERWKVGVIAGTRAVGLGLITRALKGPHDGTVAVEETRLTGAQHVLLPATHTNMIWSKAVAGQVVHFLREGRFDGRACEIPA